MKRTAVALALILALSVSSTVGTQILELAQANFLPAPAIIIYSPYPTIYTNTSIPFNVAVNILHDTPPILRILYSVDDSSNVTLTNLTRRDNEWFDPNKWGSVFQTSSILYNLAEGNHTLKVYAQDASKEMSSSVEFTVDPHYKYPEVLILSPENKTYTTTEVPLTWVCDEQIVGAHYTLDNFFQKPLSGDPALADNLTLPGNTTLTDLSNGSHTITVDVITGRGFAAATVQFEVNPASQSDIFPVGTVAVASVASITAVAAGVGVYWKKRRQDVTK